MRLVDRRQLLVRERRGGDERLLEPQGASAQAQQVEEELRRPLLHLGVEVIRAKDVVVRQRREERRTLRCGGERVGVGGKVFEDLQRLADEGDERYAGDL